MQERTEGKAVSDGFLCFLRYLLSIFDVQSIPWSLVLQVVGRGSLRFDVGTEKS